MKKTKTLALVSPYFTANSGGVERYVNQIASGLQSDYDWKIIVITTNPKNEGDIVTQQDGYTIYKLAYDVKLSNTPFSFSWFGKLRKIFKDEAPDIINIHSPVPGIGNVAALVASHIPVVVTYHAGSMKKGNILFDIPIWLYEHVGLHILLKRATKIVSASDFVRTQFLKSYKNNRTITPGTDTNLFKPNKAIKNKRPTLLSVAGQLTEAEQYKGVARLITITAELKKQFPNILLTIVGDGPMQSVYQKQAQLLGIEDNVVFTGRLKGTGLVQEYQKAWCYVSASTNDNIPTVIIEAMACGLPVVAYGVGAIPLLIENNATGFVVKLGDKTSLTQKIHEIFSNSKKAAAFGSKGYKKARLQFDWSAKIRETNEVLSAVLHEKEHTVKVAQVVGYYPPHMGGMEVVVEEISKHLSANDCDVSVITSTIGAEQAPLSEKKGAVTIERLQSFEFAHTPVMWQLPIKLMSLPKQSIVHVHLAQIFTPEISLLISKIRNLPLVIHFHLDVEPSGALGRLFVLYKKYILGAVLRSADKVIVFSHTQKELLVEKYHLDKKKIAIIPNGVGEEFFYEKLRPTPKNTLKLLYVGRLTLQKRVDRLLEALSIVTTPVEITIVGDGEDREELIERAKEQNLTNVHFVGRKSGIELKSQYRSADAFVISSDKEGMPLVVLEAMAAGLPIIASNVLGLTELVKNVGVLVNNPSGKTFAKAIDTLSHDKKQLKVLSMQSLKKAREYSWDATASKIKSLYETLYQ